MAPPLQGPSGYVGPETAVARAAEVRLCSAELMLPGIAGLLLHGSAGIGKSMLAAHIADWFRSERPGTQVTTVTGPVSVDHLVEILVADRPSLVVLDQFDVNVVNGTIVNRGLEAVLVCLAEEIAGRDDQGRLARIIVTARRPVTLGPPILVRRVGPLTQQSADELASSLPRLGKLTGAEREYAWRLTAGNPRSLLALDSRLADATFGELAERLDKEITARTGLPATRPLPTELDRAVAAAIASTAESVASEPWVPARADSAPDAADDDPRRPRLTRRRVLPAALITAVVVSTPFAVGPLIAGSSPAASGAAPHAAGAVSQVKRSAAAVSAPDMARTARTAQKPPPALTAQAAQAAATAWLAGNVTSGTVIGCDPGMCTSLSHRGLAPGGLMSLHPGSDLTADGLVVATPRARALLGPAIDAAAPELVASFGTGSGQVQIREVTPGGAAAYSWLLAADTASRREGGNQLMGKANVKSSGDSWLVLCGGHVDSRILIALAEMADSGPLTIVSFGAADPGAAAQVPVRSVLIDVADPAAAAASLNVQDPVMRPLAVRIGHASLWVEYGAPSPLGLFQAES
jgi:hypothetical protein